MPQVLRCRCVQLFSVPRDVGWFVNNLTLLRLIENVDLSRLLRAEALSVQIWWWLLGHVCGSSPARGVFLCLLYLSATRLLVIDAALLS